MSQTETLKKNAADDVISLISYKIAKIVQQHWHFREQIWLSLARDIKPAFVLYCLKSKTYCLKD